MSRNSRTHQFFEDVLSLNEFCEEFISDRVKVEERVHRAASMGIPIPTERDLLSLDIQISHHQHEWAKLLARQRDDLYREDAGKLDKFIYQAFTADEHVRDDILAPPAPVSSEMNLAERRWALINEQTVLRERVRLMLSIEGRGNIAEFCAYNPDDEIRLTGDQQEALDNCYYYALAIRRETDDFQQEQCERRGRRNAGTMDRAQRKAVDAKMSDVYNTHRNKIVELRRGLRHAAITAYHDLHVPFEYIAAEVQKEKLGITPAEFDKALLKRQTVRASSTAKR